MAHWPLNLLLALACLLLALPAANAQPLDVPNNARWKHAMTGTILNPRLGDFERTSITSKVPMELDVLAQYRLADGKTFATVFIFRPAITNVALWFDRATDAIASSDRWVVGSTYFSGLVGLPGASQSSAMQAVYGLDGKPFTATAVTLVPVGEWIVKIRMTSESATPDALKALTDTVIASINWPAAALQEMGAAPIAECIDKAVFEKKARPSRGNKNKALTNALLGSMGMTIVQQQPAIAKAALLCRDSLVGPHGLYRSQSSDVPGHILALNDAGRALLSYPSDNLVTKGDKPAFAVAFHDLQTTYFFREFDRPVPPQQLLDIFNAEKPVSATPTFAEKSEMEANSEAFKR